MEKKFKSSPFDNFIPVSICILTEHLEHPVDYFVRDI